MLKLKFLVPKAILALVCLPSFGAAQSFAAPGELARTQASIPAGPFSIVNLATGNLITRVPIVDLPSFPNMSFEFSLIHNSGVQINVHSSAKNWSTSAYRYVHIVAGVNGTDWIRGGTDGAVGQWHSKEYMGKGVPVKGTKDVIRGTKSNAEINAYGTKSWSYFSRSTGANFGQYTYNDWSLISFEENGFGDYKSYSYEDGSDRLLKITESTWGSNAPYFPTPKKQREITINYVSPRVKNTDVISNVVLSYPDRDAQGNAFASTRTWTINAPSGVLASVVGPVNTYNARKTASFTYVDPTTCRKIATEVDQNGGVWTYRYTGTKVSEIDPPDPATGQSVPQNTGIKIAYDDEKATVTDQLGRQTVYSHSSIDGYKRLAKIVYPPYQPIVAGGAAAPVPPVSSYETFTWDGYEVSAHRDRRNKITNYSYVSQNGRKVIRYIDTPDGRTTYSFNSDTHMLDWMSDPMGVKAKFTYNGLGQLTSKVIDPSDSQKRPQYVGVGLTEYWNYNNHGRLLSTSKGNDAATTYTAWTVYGAPTTTQTPWGATTSSTFDGLGNQLSVTPPAPQAPTFYAYDQDGALVSTTSPAGTVSQAIRYDANGRAVSYVKDLRSYVTATTHDYLGRPCSITRYATKPSTGQFVPASSTDDITTSVVYDAIGNIVQEIDGRGAVTNHWFDALDRGVRTLFPDGEERVVQYDEAGSPTKTTDGRNWSSTMTYDWANRPLTVAYQSAANTTNLSFHYRADGLRDSMTDGTGTTTYAFNGAKQLTACFQPLTGKTVSYTYDASGRRRSVAVGAQTWTYNYVNARLDSINATIGNSTPVSYAPNPDASLDTVTFGNGYATKYGYDSSGRVVDIWHRNGVGANQRHFQYGYGGSGNLTSIVDTTPGYTDATTTNTYDFADRLTGESRFGGPMAGYTFGYEYDKANNRLATIRNGTRSNYTTDSNDRFVSGDGWTMPLAGYDGNGNPTMVSGPRGVWSLIYDANNKVVKITAANGGINTYKYNGEGTRVEQVATAGTQRYILDGSDVLAITDGTNKIVEYRLSGVGSVMIAANNSVSNVYNEADIMQSTVCARDGAGAVVRKDNYDGYGQSESVVAGPATAFGFAAGHGYLSDADTGFELCGARYYIPTLGRFLTQDPSSHEGGLNLYAYCDDAPLLNVDPTGLDKWAIIAVGGDYATKRFGTFQGRAHQGNRMDHIREFKDVDTFFSSLMGMKNITRLDIHSEGRVTDLFTGDPSQHITAFFTGGFARGSTTSTYEIAQAIISGKIDIEKNGGIRSFACNQMLWAATLSGYLTAGGRGDITVVGANGNVAPANGEKSATTCIHEWKDEKGILHQSPHYAIPTGFYYYRGGKQIAFRATMSYR